jgi:haloacetate dehalogenase
MPATMKLGEDFVSFTIPITHEVSIQGSQAGEGPPLLLLHGFPQTHLIWHKIAPTLTSSYRVVALDLRGYGASSKPPGDASHGVYSKRTMAQDVVTVMDRLNYKKFYVCGHDRGGRVTHQLCIDHPDKVIKAMVLDIAPTLAMFEQTDKLFASVYWHWFFLIQPAPFPELMLNMNPETFTQKFMALPGVPQDTFHPDALKAYTDLFRDKAGCHGMCEDYRAGASIDMQDQREDIVAGRKIQCPLKVIWAKKGLIERKFNTLEEWRKVSNAEVVGEAFESGHYIPEEKPEELLQHILDWFK